MQQLIAMIQTTWPHIRVKLYRLDDSHFQFQEEGEAIEGNNEAWAASESELYDDFEAAKAAMIKFYCEVTEDEYIVEPESVTVLEAPDFKGESNPILRVRRP